MVIIYERYNRWTNHRKENTPDGGPRKRMSVNFGSPYGTTSVSFTLGKRTDEVASYSLSVPGYIYCKLWVKKKYECKKYVVEKKFIMVLAMNGKSGAAEYLKYLYPQNCHTRRYKK